MDVWYRSGREEHFDVSSDEERRFRDAWRHLRTGQATVGEVGERVPPTLRSVPLDAVVAIG